MRFKYLVFSTLLLSLSLHAVENYEAEYRFKSSEVNLKGIRKLNIDTEGNSSLTFKAKSALARLYFETNFYIQDNSVKTESYIIEVKPGFVNRDQEIYIDSNAKKMRSSGRDEWDVEMPEVNVLDPLNAQIQIRINVMQGKDKFSLDLLEIENGSVEPNLYSITSENKECYIGDELYSCIELTRIRDNGDRKTTYLMAKELDYMFIEIKDVGPKRTNMLTLEKILSLG